MPRSRLGHLRARIASFAVNTVVLPLPGPALHVATLDLLENRNPLGIIESKPKLLFNEFDVSRCDFNSRWH